jgi:hypothetical protein
MQDQAEQDHAPAVSHRDEKAHGVSLQLSDIAFDSAKHGFPFIIANLLA